VAFVRNLDFHVNRNKIYWLGSMRKLENGELVTLDPEIIETFYKHGIEVLEIRTKKDKEGNHIWIIKGKFID